MNQKLRASLVAAAMMAPATAASVHACEVRLKHPVPNCPAVTYSPDDCFEGGGGPMGKAGDTVTSPATLHIMTSGHTYYCPSHEGCVEKKDLRFKECTFTRLPMSPEISKEYIQSFFVH